MYIRSSLLTAWSPELAWWLGAFLGDGHTSADTPTISLVGAHLTVARWRNLICPSAKCPVVKNAPSCSRVAVYSHELSGWLRGRGLSGPKSFNLPWPDDLPDELLPHFVRGLWDTDGCVSLTDPAKAGKGGRPSAHLVYVSVFRPFVERLEAELRRVAGFPEVSVGTQERPTAPIHRLAYTGVVGEKLADFLYGEAPEHLRNEDRVEAYQRLLANRILRETPCACGKPSYTREGKCRSCWVAAQPKITGPGTTCTSVGCTRPVVASGQCNACRRRAFREAHPAQARGDCPCGSPATKTDPVGTVLVCAACYERRRRGVPTRFELPTPEGGWKTRARKSTTAPLAPRN